MRKELRELDARITQENEYKNLHNTDKQRLNEIWITAKKQLEDHEAELKNKEREVEDLRENHIMTKNMYKQKIKHLLFQNQDYHADMRIRQEIELKQAEDQNRIIMRDLESDNRDLKKKLKEQELSHNNYKFAMEFENAKQKIFLRQEYERAARELNLKYELKKKKLRQEMEELRNNKIKQLEQKKTEKINEITELHFEQYKEIKNYYSDITASNLSLIKQFKNDIQTLQGQEETDKKRLQKIREQHKRIRIPLDNIKEDIKRLEKDEIEWRKIVAQKKKLWDLITDKEKKCRDLEYKYEVQLQLFQYLEKEKNALFEKYEECMYDIHQKSGLKVSTVHLIRRIPRFLLTFFLEFDP